MAKSTQHCDQIQIFSLTLQFAAFLLFRIRHEIQTFWPCDEHEQFAEAGLQSEQKDWILYKLDNGYNHILLDEAQDTILEQWQIVAALV